MNVCTRLRSHRSQSNQRPWHFYNHYWDKLSLVWKRQRRIWSLHQRNTHCMVSSELLFCVLYCRFVCCLFWLYTSHPKYWEGVGYGYIVIPLSVCPSVHVLKNKYCRGTSRILCNLNHSSSFYLLFWTYQLHLGC